MKKLSLSLFLILTFTIFGLNRRGGFSNDKVISVSPEFTRSPVPSPVVTFSGGTPPPKPAVTPKSSQTPSSTPSPTPKKKLGPYQDGQYIGSVADAYYGNVQVEAIIQNGQITDVKFLQYPNDRSTSRYINSIAMPDLTQEAIRAQNANVDIVSGATDTSGAFRESLAFALSKAQ